MTILSRSLPITAILCGFILSGIWITYHIHQQEFLIPSDLDIHSDFERSNNNNNNITSIIPSSDNNEINHSQIVICAKIGNELAYLIEWLEFHWLQGVRRVDLYVDDIAADISSRLNMDQTRSLINHYINQLDRNDYVQIYSISSLLGDDSIDVSQPDLYPSITAPMHRITQQMSIKHCFERHKEHSEWIISLDIDEFLYSPTNKTLLEFLNSLNEGSDIINKAYQKHEIAGILVFPVVYGLGGGPIQSPTIAIIESVQDGTASIMFAPNITSNNRDDSKISLLTSLNDSETNEQAFIDILKTTATPYHHWSGFASKHLFDNKKFESFWLEETTQKEKTESNAYRPEVVHKMREILAQVCSDIYPLVIEQQLDRMPVLELEGFDTVAAATLEYEPNCFEFINKLQRPNNINLRGRGDRGEMLNQLGSPPLSECVPGELPAHITNIGKTLIWTGKTNNKVKNTSEYNDDSHPQLCLLPSIHTCSHNTQFPIFSANMKTQLRIDHHILRSASRRMTGEKPWKMWNSKKLKWAVSFANRINDQSKLRFVQKIRQALQKLSLKCRSAELFFAPYREPLVEWFASQCDLGDLLLRKQIMCPPDFPFAGFHQTNIPPPTVTSPRGWCSNANPMTNESIEHENMPPLQCENLSDTLKDQNDTSCSSWQRQISGYAYTLNNTIMCPGAPLTTCCDYSPDLNPLIQKWFNVVGVSQAYSDMMNRNLNLSEWKLYPYLSF